MKAKKISAAMICALLAVGLLAGCKNGTAEETMAETTAEITMETTEEATVETDAETEAETDAETIAETTEEATVETAAETAIETVPAQTDEKDGVTDFSFSEISNLEFWFGSGAGGWCTVLYVNEDGSFEGSYHDSEMGERSDEYPNGAYYWCNFTGQFTDPVKVNSYTYAVSLQSIDLQKEAGISEIVDGFLTVSSEPLGLDNADVLYIYLPGAPVAELPEGYYDWVAHSSSLTSSDTVLPYYGLYNWNAEEGFSSYELAD